MKKSPFLKTPVCLLKIPAYGRFDGSGVGHMYRVLAASICRRGSEEMAKSEYYTGEGSPLATLAELYDQGILAAYHSDERLGKMLNVGKRSLQLYRAKLKKLGLIRMSRLHGGYIYELGENGSLYIDTWPELAEKYPEEFSEKLVQALAAKKVSEAVEEFFARGRQTQAFFGSQKRNEFREKTKSISSKKGENRAQKQRAEQEKSQQNLFDIIDNNIIDINKNMLVKNDEHSVKDGVVRSESHVGAEMASNERSGKAEMVSNESPVKTEMVSNESPVKTEMASNKHSDKAGAASDAAETSSHSAQTEAAQPANIGGNTESHQAYDNVEASQPAVDEETLKRIKFLAWRAQNIDISDFEAMSLVREAQGLGLPHWEAKRLLTIRVKRQGYRYFDALPRYSLLYHNLVVAKDQSSASKGSQANTLFRLCLAIREDWTGRYLASDEQSAWRAGIAIIKHLLDKYPYEQVIWSLNKAVAYRDFVEGLSKTEKYLHAVADAYASDYQEWKAYCRQREIESEQIAQAREAHKREEEELRQEIQRKLEEKKNQPKSDLDIWFEGIMQRVQWKNEFLRARQSLHRP